MYFPYAAVNIIAGNEEINPADMEHTLNNERHICTKDNILIYYFYRRTRLHTLDNTIQTQYQRSGSSNDSFSTFSTKMRRLILYFSPLSLLSWEKKDIYMNK